MKTASGTRFDIRSRLGGHLHGDDPPAKTIVKPTALGPVANTDTKLLIYGLFQKGRVLAQDGDTLAAADFFTTEIWTPAGLVTFYVLFAIQLKTRRVHISIPLRRYPLLGPCQFLSRNDRHSAMRTNALRGRQQACFVQPLFGHAGSIANFNC